MAVLPIRPTPFFANKNQAFWNLQLAGWGGATLLRAMSALANGQSPDRLVIILIATITGFSLSLILAVIYGQVIRQRPLVTWGSTALVLAALALLPVALDVLPLGTSAEQLLDIGRWPLLVLIVVLSELNLLMLML